MLVQFAKRFLFANCGYRHQVSGVLGERMWGQVGALQWVAQSVLCTSNAAERRLSRTYVWHLLETFVNIRRGPTANLEGEPSALSNGYAAFLKWLQHSEMRSAGAP